MSTETIKDFRMTVRIANNQIRQRREVLGLSQAKAAELAGVNYTSWNELEALRGSPLKNIRSGDSARTVIGTEWRSVALKMAALLRVTPEDLWPEAIQAVEQSKIEMTVNAEQIAALASAGVAPPGRAIEQSDLRAAIAGALEGLSPRGAFVLRQRYGLDDGGDGLTYDEIAEKLGVTRQRVRQIEIKATRSLRHPSRAAPILEAAGLDTEKP